MTGFFMLGLSRDYTIIKGGKMTQGFNWQQWLEQFRARQAELRARRGQPKPPQPEIGVRYNPNPGP